MRPSRPFAAFVLMAALGGLLAAAPAARADTRKATPRDVVVECVNPHPTFQVRVTVDNPERVYREGDEVLVTVRSERDGYLYLVYINAENKAKLIFPNQYQTDNRIMAGQPITIPDSKAAFRLRVQAPFGTEYLKAIVSTAEIKEVDKEKLVQGNYLEM